MEVRKKVCVLEDDDDIREIIGFLLESEHYEVFAYPSVKDFTLGATAVMPDVFILDIMLPDGNGLDVCNEIKSNVRLSSIPVIMMSANYTENDVKTTCNAQDFIRKPFDIGDFVDRVALQLRH
ncbi:response regulator transcription factor [Pedobacter sp. N23S346]|uniref:response regulator transcription factor n=1 Tax=Pedobacter sp. N23S346 TaxID=3402750 RepID=UPI003ACA99EB